MSTHDLLVTPSTTDMQLLANTGLGISPLIASAQTIDRGGMKWQATLTFLNKRGDDRGELMALIAELRGQANRVRVPVSDNPKRGGYGGTPLVQGGSQTGNTLIIDGLTPNRPGWIRRGDYFSVFVNGEHELKISTADGTSSPGGALTLQFEPRLRASPLDNAQIRVEDGVLPKPQGVFLFENQANGWSSRPGQTSKLSNTVLTLIEDVFATQ